MGRGNILFVAGWCFDPGSRTRSLSLRAAGRTTAVVAHSMPRADVLGEQGEDLGYWSGFWGHVPVSPGDAAGEIELVAELRDGSTHTTSLGSIALDAEFDRTGPSTPEFKGAGPRVAICMASYEPPIELFRAQVESIRAQTHENWVCVVCDDGSSPDRWRGMQEVLAADARFVAWQPGDRRGFYGNFERALAAAPREAELIALADHDDVWYPEKLERLAAKLERPDVTLAYSDARYVVPNGEIFDSSMWNKRPNQYESLATMLIANTITGAASLFRAELIDDLLPFPQRIGNAFHDQWLGAVALGLGDLAYVGEPLWDYMAHPGQVTIQMLESGTLPKDEFGKLNPPSPRRLREKGLAQSGGDALLAWRRQYFLHVCQARLFAAVLALRGGERISAEKRRELERIAGADSAGGLGWLTMRWGRSRVRKTATFGRELAFAHGVAWRSLTERRARMRRRPRHGHRQGGPVPPPP